MSNEWVQDALKLSQADPKNANAVALFGIAAKLGEISTELQRLNERGDRFNEAMLSFFEKLTDPFAAQEEDGSLRSGRLAAAPDGGEACDPCECGGNECPAATRQQEGERVPLASLGCEGCNRGDCPHCEA